MQNDIGVLAGRLAGGQVSDVSFDEMEAGPCFCRDERFDFREIAAMAGGEIVEGGDLLA